FPKAGRGVAVPQRPQSPAHHPHPEVSDDVRPGRICEGVPPRPGGRRKAGHGNPGNAAVLGKRCRLNANLSLRRLSYLPSAAQAPTGPSFSGRTTAWHGEGRWFDSTRDYFRKGYPTW